VPILVKIDEEMPPWECSQTDRDTADANVLNNLSHAICYSYGTVAAAAAVLALGEGIGSLWMEHWLTV